MAPYLLSILLAGQVLTPLFAKTRKKTLGITSNKKLTQPQASNPAYFIQEIQIENPRLLTKRIRRKLIAPYTNTYLNMDQIKKLIKSLRAFYIEKGYTTMQVQLVLGQSLQEGILKLAVVDGFIEAIRLNQSLNKDKGILYAAFPGLKGRLLYLPDLEQGIDQLNSIPSNHATLRILPGKQEGGSIIQVNNLVNKPLRIDLATDNLGEAASGKWQGKVNIGLDHLLRINDHWVVNYTTNKAKKIADKKFINHSWMVNGNFHIGYYTLAATYSFKYALSPIAPEKHAKNQQVNFQLSKNHLYNYELKRIIYKTRIHKNLLMAGFEYRTSQNYIKDQLIGVQSMPYASIKCGTNHTGLFLSGQYVLNFTYQQGVHWLGAKKHVQAKDPNSVHTQFKKLEIHLLWLKPFYIGPITTSYQVDVTTQFSRNQLPGFAQFSLAGFSQVRGFKKHYSGNQGFICKQELSCLNLFPKLPLLRPLQLMAALDIGYLPKLLNNPTIGNQSLTIASWVVGCRYNKSWISIECLYAKPFYQAKKLADNSYEIYFNLSIKLHHLFF